MEPRDAPVPQDGQSSSESAPPLRRRLSMDEDLFYQRIMTTPRRPSQPPPYEPDPTLLDDHDDSSNQDLDADLTRDEESRRGRALGKGKDEGKHVNRLPLPTARRMGSAGSLVHEEYVEVLPDYSSSITMEGIFSKKHEIENTTKRAEDRHWHTVAVTLNGTALNVYSTKRDWGFSKTREGPTICPDNPPWIKRSKLEKTYSLQYADAGIAADYHKRRYVIRVRAETDQFLLSCVELSTFVKWLECLFAAIDVAAPIDERDFPRDMSIPRIQRIRWFRGQSPARFPDSTPNQPQAEDATPAEDAEGESRSLEVRRSSIAQPPVQTPRRPVPMPTPAPEMGRVAESIPHESRSSGPLRVPARRLSTTLYPNEALDPYSGKWYPEHKWSDAHDMLYAKLCYSNLLFRSPRKSNYIISKGKKWFVDWATGRMVRVLPPEYGEVDFFGPWQIVHTENRRI